MRLSDAGLAFLKDREGCELMPYDDGSGYQTIGYGHRIPAGQTWGRITQSRADELLRADVGHAENYVNHLIKSPLNQCQFDALVSLVFNNGSAPLMRPHGTLGMKLNAGDYAGAADEFERWCHAGNPPVVVKGLLARRRMERELFLST